MSNQQQQPQQQQQQQQQQPQPPLHPQMMPPQMMARFMPMMGGPGGMMPRFPPPPPQRYGPPIPQRIPINNANAAQNNIKPNAPKPFSFSIAPKQPPQQSLKRALSNQSIKAQLSQTQNQPNQNDQNQNNQNQNQNQSQNQNQKSVSFGLHHPSQYDTITVASCKLSSSDCAAVIADTADVASFPRKASDRSMGSIIVANEQYVSYSVAKGKMRIISQRQGSKGLFAEHKTPVIDSAFCPNDEDWFASVSKNRMLVAQVSMDASQQQDTTIEHTVHKSVSVDDQDDSDESKGASEFKFLVWHPSEPRLLAVRTPCTLVNENGQVTLQEQEPIVDVAFSSSGAVFAVCGESGAVRMYTNTIPAAQVGDFVAPASKRLLWQQQTLITVTNTNQLKLWDQDSQQCVSTLSLQADAADGIDFVSVDATGTFIAVVCQLSAYNGYYLIRARDGRFDHVAFIPTTLPVMGIAFGTTQDDKAFLYIAYTKPIQRVILDTQTLYAGGETHTPQHNEQKKKEKEEEEQQEQEEQKPTKQTAQQGKPTQQHRQEGEEQEEEPAIQVTGVARQQEKTPPVPFSMASSTRKPKDSNSDNNTNSSSSTLSSPAPAKKTNSIPLSPAALLSQQPQQQNQTEQTQKPRQQHHQQQKQQQKQKQKEQDDEHKKQQVKQRTENTLIKRLNSLFRANFTHMQEMLDQRDANMRTFIQDAVVQHVEKVLPGIVRTELTTVFRNSFKQTLLPSFEGSTKRMFRQINDSLEKAVRNNQRQIGAHMQEAVNSLNKIQQEFLQAHAAHAANVEQESAESKKEAVWQQIQQLTESEDYEKAFTLGLSSGDVPLVCEMLQSLEAADFFDTDPLSSPVLLSLIQQLAFDLGTKTSLKLQWLCEALLILDADDVVIVDHVKPILTEVLNNTNAISSDDVQITRYAKRVVKVIKKIL